MANVSQYVTKISDLNMEKADLINQITNKDKEIQELTIEWQSKCPHPEAYVENNTCRACGKEL
jgi:hypothetical protein